MQHISYFTFFSKSILPHFSFTVVYFCMISRHDISVLLVCFVVFDEYPALYNNVEKSLFFCGEIINYFRIMSKNRLHERLTLCYFLWYLLFTFGPSYLYIRRNHVHLKAFFSLTFIL